MKHPKHYDTTPEISKRMSRVRLKRGAAETKLAKALWHSGFRYRLNYKKLPGSPDIAITKQKVAIFVDGEFWHGYDWENKKEKLKANRQYWIEKIEENIARDLQVDRCLCFQGWTVLRFWEREVKRDLDGCIQAVKNAVFESWIQQFDLEQDRAEGIDSIDDCTHYPDDSLADHAEEASTSSEASRKPGQR